MSFPPSKSLLIDVVSNGWIVRPFNYEPTAYTTANTNALAVFRTLPELQAALPRLLTPLDRPAAFEWPPPYPAGEIIQDGDSTKVEPFHSVDPS